MLLVSAAVLMVASGCARAMQAKAEGTQTVSALRNTSSPVVQRVDALVKRMTLKEKVSQMMDQSPAIPRLGIPAYNWWNEGLHGVARAGYATMFPQAIGMAATWDTELVHREGSVISTEARAKYNHAVAHGNHGRYYGLTFWAPNINIVRDPRWGRGQETYGEDPTLTGTLGAAYVRGMQGDNPDYLKVVATPKHFLAYSGPEPTRHAFNLDPSPHDLEATYLPAFRKTIVDAHADSVMCSYNAVHGVPSCGNVMLQKVLRNTWGFKGYITSDCYAIKDFVKGHDVSVDIAHASAKAVLAGTDTNCGESYKSLVKAVHESLLPVSAINTAVKRLFTARVKLGLFDPKSKVPFNSISFTQVDSPAHRELAEKAARESMVLLKNRNNTLPLKSGIKRIAVVGPNAASLRALEGNYNAIPEHPVLPLDGIEKQFPKAVITYAQGSPYVEKLQLPAPRTLFHTTNGKQGLTGHYYASSDFSGTPVVTRIDPELDFDWHDARPVPGLKQDHFSVRWTGTIAVPKPGTYRFGILLGKCTEPACTAREGLTIKLDGTPVDFASEPSAVGWDKDMPEAILHLPDTKPHHITLSYSHNSAKVLAGISLRWTPPVAVERERAVAAANKADVVVAFVGLTADLEGEEMPVHVAGFNGGDRTKLTLPATQLKLLKAVKATGKPLVVVLMNGSALAVDWAAKNADAILEAWYPGEAGGTAIAQTLAGVNNPGGKLPLTFYTGVDQLPPFADYSMADRTYRYFTGKPLFSFGYGLSYTRFTFSGLKLSSPAVAAGKTLTVEATIKNTGEREGDEVAQVYLTPPKTDVSPRHTLVAFRRVHLAAGVSRHLSFKLDPRNLSVVDDKGVRRMAAGTYTLSLGGGQPGSDAIMQARTDKGATAAFTIIGNKILPQ